MNVLIVFGRVYTVRKGVFILGLVLEPSIKASQRTWCLGGYLKADLVSLLEVEEIMAPGRSKSKRLG